jgi:hypothetical protein
MGGRFFLFSVLAFACQIAKENLGISDGYDETGSEDFFVFDP